MSTTVDGTQATTAAPTGQPVTWHVDDLPWTPLTGLFINKSGYKTVVDAAFSSNAYSIELTTVGPGGFSPTHVEPHAHVFYVLAGHGEVTVGEEVKDVREGSVSPISAGVPHSFRNLGDVSLEMLVIYHPPRVRNQPAKTLKAQVHTIRHEANGVVSVELRPQPGVVFPSFDAGSHIDLHLGNGLVRSYSLCNPAGEEGRYVVGVLNVPNSRGGSRYVHEHLRVGTEIEISKPRNNFALEEDAGHTVLIAGGIGITPILCMLRRLRELGRSVELLYCARSRREAAFTAEIEQIGAPVTWHFDDEHGGPPDLERFIAGSAPDAHYYACGPAPMLDAFERICAKLDLKHVHVERFVARDVSPAAHPSYKVELRRSDKRFEVSPDKSLLQTLLDAGVNVEHGCEQGLCGACKTRVLDGQPDHRDSVLSASERAANDVMCVCVSGSKGDTLVLDL